MGRKLFEGTRIFEDKLYKWTGKLEKRGHGKWTGIWLLTQSITSCFIDFFFGFHVSPGSYAPEFIVYIVEPNLPFLYGFPIFQLREYLETPHAH